MLKANITKGHTEVEICADLFGLCTDLTNLLSAINEKLSESPAVGHAFRVMFTAGFMEGICFNDDREHMTHYLEEGRKLKAEHEEKRELVKCLDDLVDFLKKQRSELLEAKKMIDEQEKKDEAE